MNDNEKLLLVVNHNIFLTKSQRYELVNGQTQEVIGVSLPVWFEKGGKTTEPAEEVFCKYVITNPLNTGGFKPIQKTEKGYLICLPQIEPHNETIKLSDEDYKNMTQKELEYLKVIHETFSEWYENNSEPFSGKNLLDIKDGGSEYLKFEQHNMQQLDKKLVHILHVVELKRIELLEETLIM